MELMQPGQVGPAHACKQLPVVPETVRCSDQVRIRASEVGPLAEYAAIEGRGYGGQVRWLQVPTRTQQFGEDAGPARNRDRARRGRHQHQAAAALRVLVGELLSQPSTPRDAQDINFLMPYSVKRCATRRARPRKRNGKRVGGDPPTPGTSKRIVPIFFPLTLSSAAMKGSNTSRLAPMPLTSRSGGLLSSPRRMATKTRAS